MLYSKESCLACRKIFDGKVNAKVIKEEITVDGQTFQLYNLHVFRDPDTRHDPYIHYEIMVGGNYHKTGIACKKYELYEEIRNLIR